MKAKFKISQLAAVDQKAIELVHPVHGATGIFLTLAGPLHEKWKEALKVYNASKDDEADRGFKLFASSVIGWDEEAMEQPYSPEAVLALFKDPKNEWIPKQISDAVIDNKTFFL